MIAPRKKRVGRPPVPVEQRKKPGPRPKLRPEAKKPIDGMSRKHVGGTEPTARDRILAALADGPKTAQELVELCSLSSSGCYVVLKELREVKKVEPGTDYRWSLVS